MQKSFADLVQQAREGHADFRSVSRQDRVAAAREQYQSAWDEIQARHEQGESGLAVLRAFSAAADELMRGLFEFALEHIGKRERFLSRAALCALGGYGRRELSPCSDLDLVLLHDAAMGPGLEEFNSYLVPFLWDVGFKASYSTHSVNEALILCKSDPEVFTTYMQARLLLGDSGSFARLKGGVRGLGPEAAKGLVARLRQREHPSQLPEEHRDLYAQEPNIKETIGGLRDYHAGLWMVWLEHGGHSLDDLLSAGMLGQEEYLEVVDGLDFLWRVRNEIHFHTRKPENQITFELQRHLAGALGYGDEGHSSIDRFMQDYYAAARRVRWFLALADRICNRTSELEFESHEELVPGVAIVNGELRAGFRDPHWFEEHPPRLMEIYWEAARRGVRIAPATEQRVRKNLHLVNESFRSHDLVRSFFLGICRRPMQAGAILRQMSNSGLLGAYLPEFAAVQGVVRYEDFHSFPVEEHTLRAIEAITEIPALAGGVGQLFQRVYEHLLDPQALVLAILLHDLGKAGGEEHVEEGVRLAHGIGARMGLSEDLIDRVAFLVQHHMLMTTVSMYRDTDDIETVRKFAETMGAEERLRDLLILSFCDLRAVGPNVWTEWKGALLAKLFLKAERLLDKRPAREEASLWELPKTQEVIALTPPEMILELRAFLEDLDLRYLFAFPAESIVEHLRCLQEARQSVFAMHAHEQEEGITEAVICTRDRHGLFADLAGCFASQMADVRRASIFTTSDGYAMDVFSVVDASRRMPLAAGQISGLRTVLQVVLADGEDIQPQVDKARKRLFALPQPKAPVKTRVEFDNDASTTDTVIDIETGDRTGLLYDMARAMAGMGLEVHAARIVTDARRVRDAFYVRSGGGKIDSQQTRAEVHRQLRDAIEGLTPAEVKGGS